MTKRRNVFGLVPILLSFFGPPALQAQPGTTTQICVQKQAPLDAPVSDADGVDLFSVTFQKPDGSLLNVPILWSWERGVSTRKSITEQIGRKLRRVLRDNELPEEWVTVSDGMVILTHTPKGVGKNTGTPDKPVMSPPGADHNSLHLEITTTNQNEK